MEIQETNVGKRISILEIQCVPIFGQNRNFVFLGPNLPKNGFWEVNFKNLSLGLEPASLRYYVHQFSGKTDNFEFFGSKFAQNGFWGLNFKNLSLDSESVHPRYHMSQLSVKIDSFKFFGLNLGKLPNYARYFGSNIIEGIAESWVEVDMSCVEVDGAGCMLE